MFFKTTMLDYQCYKRGVIMSEVIAKRNSSKIMFMTGMWLMYGVMLAGLLNGSTYLVVMTGILYTIGYVIFTLAAGDFYDESENHEYLTTNAIKSKSLFSLLCFDKGKVHFHHYPEIKSVIVPVFHLRTMFNPTSVVAAILFTAFYTAFHMVIKEDIIFPLELFLIGFGLGWVMYNLSNAKTLIAAWTIWKKPTSYEAFVTINHTKMDLYNMIDGHDLLGNNHCANLVGNMKYIAGTATLNSHKINRMIVENRIDSELMINEVNLLAYAINVFIPKKTEAINEFSQRHRERKDAAIRVFITKVLPELEEETKDLYQKIYDINSLISRIETKEEYLQRREDESIVIADARSMLRAGSRNVASPVFTDFHSLNFESIEKSVAAKSIVKRVLPPLIEAREKTTDEAVFSKINDQIEEVKQFVKALALDTEESKERDRRIENTNAKNPLSLERIDYSDEINSMLAVHQRYMDSYNALLPPNKKKETIKLSAADQSKNTTPPINIQPKDTNQHKVIYE